MRISKKIQSSLAAAIKDALGLNAEAADLTFSPPPEDKLGDLALAMFSLAKAAGQAPSALAQTLAQKIQPDDYIAHAQNFGPYINLWLTDNYRLAALKEMAADKKFGQCGLGQGQKILLEFSGPNTNKPQHIGHLRNNVIGQSLVNIFRSCDYKVIPVNMINDRGIHIVKSMIAWSEFGQGETPATTGVKGDHLVGKYYVIFSQKLAEEKKQYLADNKIDWDKLGNMERREVEEKFLGQSQWMAKARAMLRAWEAGDKGIRALWKKMNSWVYDGYKITYSRLGIKFAKNYYESQTYLSGKDLIAQGLEKKIFYKKDDGSTWVDLTADNLEEKLVLRSDGTSVYITQDLGTAKARYDEFNFDKAIYVVASEQDRHFKTLFAILKKLGFGWADKLYHLSYGLLSLPEGRIKSREGQTADADDLMDEAQQKAKEIMAAAQKQIATNAAQEEDIAATVGLGALKFFLLGTNPQKNIIFNPKEFISFDGYTGPFIQYTHARINNLLKKAGRVSTAKFKTAIKFNDEEKKLLQAMTQWPETVAAAANNYNPAVICQYLFNLAKVFNNFYQNHPVIKADDPNQKKLRLQLCSQTKKIIKDGLNLLGIAAPEVM